MARDDATRHRGKGASRKHSSQSDAAALAAAPHRVRGAARREALIEAVLRIVMAVGIDAVTHRRVAEEAELPLASTTYYFKSKEELLAAALELAAERDTRRLLAHTSAILGSERLRPQAAIEAAVDAITVPLEEGLKQGRGSLAATYALLLEGARRPEIQQVAAHWTEAYLLALGQLLERGGSSHPRADAELLLGAADGLIVDQLASGTSLDLRPRLRRLAAALVKSS